VDDGLIKIIRDEQGKIVGIQVGTGLMVATFILLFLIFV